MHEYSLMERVIETIEEKLDTQENSPTGCVKEVTLKVGALELHSEASFRQAYELLTKNTVLEKSSLNLVIVPATLKCPVCGYSGPCPEGQADGHDPIPVAECPSCGSVSNVLGGRGVESIDLILEDV